MATKRSSPIWEINQKDLEELVAKSNSYKQVLAYFGLENKGNNFKTLRKCMDEYRIDYSHFIKVGQNLSYVKKISFKDFLVENSGYTNRFRLKIRLVRDGLLEDICSVCKQLPLWNGKPLTLQLDHINGKSDDNRIENLRMICPNCHSQTETFSGKSRKS